MSAYGKISALTRTIPNALIEQFIAAKAPFDPRDAIPLEKVNLRVRSVVSSLDESLEDMLQWFDSDARSIRIERDFDYVGELNETRSIPSEVLIKRSLLLSRVA